MSVVIQWLNSNSGALMVLITLVYVIATISISRSNKKSADSSRAQIEASQKQQEQNAGLQLYALRKEAISKIGRKQFNEVFWDIPLLFNDKLFDEFQKVAFKAGRIEELQKSIEHFETEFQALYGASAFEHVKQIRESKKLHDGFQDLKDAVFEVHESTGSHADITKSVKEYIDQVQETKRLSSLRDVETLQLVFKLQDFIKKSIQ